MKSRAKRETGLTEEAEQQEKKKNQGMDSGAEANPSLPRSLIPSLPRIISLSTSPFFPSKIRSGECLFFLFSLLSDTFYAVFKIYEITNSRDR